MAFFLLRYYLSAITFYQTTSRMHILDQICPRNQPLKGFKPLGKRRTRHLCYQANSFWVIANGFCPLLRYYLSAITHYLKTKTARQKAERVSGHASRESNPDDLAGPRQPRHSSPNWLRSTPLLRHWLSFFELIG